MPLDALCLSAVARELKRDVVGARIDRITQPEKDVFLFALRGGGLAGGARLLISAGGGSARVHLTGIQRENPDAPPMLCMLLRKHLAGARIVDIIQPDMERLYDIRLAAFDELGNPSEKRLLAEMLGRRANLVLVDGEGRIIDCLRKTGGDEGGGRRLLPGLFYEYPPAQGKPLFFALGAAELEERRRLAEPSEPADRWLVSAFAGLSPLLARELAFRAAGSADAPVGAVDSAVLLSELGALTEGGLEPVMLRDPLSGKPADICCFEPLQYGRALEPERFGSFSELLDAFYTERERLERLAQRSQALVKSVKSRRDRAARKLALRLEELRAAGDRERLRRRGDIIKANIYRIKKGDSLLRAEDFWSDPPAAVEIPLEPRLSPQQNAEKYYKAYAKAKNAEKILRGQIEEARTELEYLESVLEELERADGERDLEEIRRELAEEGYIAERGGGKKKSGPSTSRPLRFVSSTGAEILVGRNNAQNERLTLKEAGKNDIWLHAQRTHGSHVIARCAEDDAATILEAAALAAWYSKARNESKAPVDYTRVRNVKKMPGGRTGMVIYTDYRTVFVAPSAGPADKRKG